MPRSFVPAMVFLDTSVLKHAAQTLVRGFARPSTVRWGDQHVTLQVTQFREVDTHDGIDENLRRQTVLLPLLAQLAKRERIILVTHMEVMGELGRIRDLDSPRGPFYGAAIDWVSNPFEYDRIWYGDFGRDWQFEFVRNLQHPRFLELKRAVNAQEVSKHYRNELMDAFHILCAESCGADYFLTNDFKLQRQLATHKKAPPRIPVVTPRELVEQLFKSRHLRIRDTWRCVRAELQERKAPLGPPEGDLIELGKRLEQRGYFDR